MSPLSPQTEEALTRLSTFRDHLCRYQEVCAEYEALCRYHNRTSDPEDPPPDPPRELKEIEQKLLPDVHSVRGVLDHLLAAKSWKAPPDLWNKCVDDGWGNWSGQQLSRHLMMAIGAIKDDPSILDPLPGTAQPARQSHGAPSQVIHVHGGQLNIGQTASGDVIQSISPCDIVELRLRLKDLVQAIDQLAATKEECQSLAVPIEQAHAELAKPTPTLGSLATALATVKTIAGISKEPWTGWEKVQQIAAAVAPQLNEVVQHVAASHVIPH